jgi:hypothetical protein
MRRYTYTHTQSNYSHTYELPEWVADENNLPLEQKGAEEFQQWRYTKSWEQLCEITFLKSWVLRPAHRQDHVAGGPFKKQTHPFQCSCLQNQMTGIMSYSTFTHHLRQECANPRCLGSRQLNCVKRQLIFSVQLPAVFSVHIKSIYQSTCTKQKTSATNEVHRPLQHCGSSVWKLLLFTLQAPTIWR